MIAVIDAIAKSDFRLRAFNFVLVLALLAEARRLDSGTHREWKMLHRMHALGQVDHDNLRPRRTRFGTG